MYKASRSANVRVVKSSVEWWKTFRVLTLWQACLLIGILLLSGTGRAQLSTASLSGVVKDSSGAVVPSANIVLRDVDTAVEHTTTSNGAGTYLFADITPGKYTVRASAQGFAEQQVPAFALTVGQAATIDFALSVGSQTTVVTVQGATPQLEATNANLGLVVGTKQVNDLPLNGRDFTQLLTLTPGMSTVNNSQSGTSQHNYAEPEPSNQYSTIPSVNGMGNRSDYFFTDGLSNFGSFHSVYAVPPIIDEIQEFKVVSHADSAEYGSVTGGVINVVTKSGSNNLHGSAFEYVRNGIFDAQRPFTGSRPDFTENEFGGVVGGPVLLPKLYNGKNKTFFFGAYQGFRYSLTEATEIRVPTPAELSGDLSDWPTQIYNPFSTTYNTSTGTFTRTPFPGNKITPDPNMVAYAKFIFPTGGAAFDANGHNATDSTPDSQTINQWTARIDEKIGDNDSVWFRYSSDSSSETNSGGVPGLPQTVAIPNKNYGGSYVHIFNAGLVLQVAFGRTEVGDNVTEQYTDTAKAASILSQVGFVPAFAGNFAADPGSSFLPGPGIGGSAVGGSPYANPQPGLALHPDVPNSNQYSGTLTKTIGKQTLSLGGGYITNKFYAPITVDNLGFGAAQTANINANDPLSAVDTGDPMASFLLNVPDTADRRNVVTETRPGGVMSEFLQDSWRASNKLTINMGLRYDLTFMPPVGTNKQIGISGGPETGDMDFNTGNYVVQKLPPLCSVRGFAPCIPGSGLPPNVVVSPNGKLYHNVDTNVGPHFGFAYKVRENLVVHGAAGIVYDNWSGVLQLAQNVDGGWPDIGQLEAGNLNTPTAANPTPTVTAQNPFAATAASANFPAPNPYALGGYDYDPNMKNPYSEQWNFGVQRLLSASTTLTLNYVGSSTHRMDVGGNYNVAAYPDPTASITSRQPFPLFASTPYDRSWGRGNYNGLQASVERRFTNGFSYAAAYTWSKSIDVGGDGYFGVEGGVPQNEYDPGQYDRSVSGLDLTHFLAVNTLYQVPFGKGARFSTGNGALDYIVGNWQFNDLFEAHSGDALTPCITSDQANIGQQSWMCYEHLNVVPGVNPKLSSRGAARWFNTAAFTTPAFGTFGDAGRNSLRGPAFWNLDMSLFREFPVGEGRHFEFRAEAFNMFNHENLGDPTVDINGGSTFGTIGKTQNLPRQLQLALKYLF